MNLKRTHKENKEIGWNKWGVMGFIKLLGYRKVKLFVKEAYHIDRILILVDCDYGDMNNNGPSSIICLKD